MYLFNYFRKNITLDEYLIQHNIEIDNTDDNIVYNCPKPGVHVSVPPNVSFVDNVITDWNIKIFKNDKLQNNEQKIYELKHPANNFADFNNLEELGKFLCINSDNYLLNKEDLYKTIKNILYKSYKEELIELMVIKMPKYVNFDFNYKYLKNVTDNEDIKRLIDVYLIYNNQIEDIGKLFVDNDTILKHILTNYKIYDISKFRDFFKYFFIKRFMNQELCNENGELYNNSNHPINKCKYAHKCIKDCCKDTYTNEHKCHPNCDKENLHDRYASHECKCNFDILKNSIIFNYEIIFMFIKTYNDNGIYFCDCDYEFEDNIINRFPKLSKYIQTL